MQKKQQGASKAITRKPTTTCNIPPIKQLTFSNNNDKALKRPNNMQTVKKRKEIVIKNSLIIKLNLILVHF